MAGPASEYHRGDQDIHEQVSTFHLVMGLTKWGSLVISSLLLIAVLAFCTDAGFVGAVASGVVVFALGVLLLGGGGKAAH